MNKVPNPPKVVCQRCHGIGGYHTTLKDRGVSNPTVWGYIILSHVIHVITVMSIWLLIISVSVLTIVGVTPIARDCREKSV